MFQLPFHEVHVWRASLDVSPETSARLQATLSDDECRRSARFRFERDRRRFVAAHGVLRALLGNYLQTPADRVRYVYNAFGKPGLSPEFDGRLAFNLSHSGDLALVAIAADARLGIDLERIRGQADYADIARYFFSAAEADQLSALPEPLCADAFLACWTKKEAYLKACGNGLAGQLDGFSVPLTTDPGEGPANLDGASGEIAPERPWSLYTLQPAPGYIGALAIEGRGWRVSERQWDMAEASEKARKP